MKKKFIIEQLEERLMLSADFQPVPFDGGLPDDLSALTVVETPLVPSTSASDNAERAEQRHELVFIDSMVSEYQKLVDDIMAQQDNGTHFEVIVLDSNRDGIEQISETLNIYEKIDAVHLFSHGSDGAVQLGDMWLNSDTLDAHADSIEGWQKALTDEADILFYGCDLAKGNDGRALIESLGILTGADIAASTDITGLKTLGGDWNLEYNAGSVETAVAFSTHMRQSWDGVLATITVTSNADSGAGSLREAINNAAAGDTIAFNIGGGGAQTIQLNTSLTITTSVIIDGTTQPGFAGTPLIELDGTNITSPDPNGITLQADNSTIKGLAINNCPNDGIEIEGNNNLIIGNFFGTDITGTIAQANMWGISVKGDNNIIGGSDPTERNIISGNVNWGIGVYLSADNTEIYGNYIGTDVTGMVPLGNGGNGIEVYNSSTNTIIGGAAPGEGNLISANGEWGIEIIGNGTDDSVIQGNLIGVDATGTATIDMSNVDGGIKNKGSASNTTIGGTAAGEGNTIAAMKPGAEGIHLSGGSNITIRGNNIFNTDGGGIVIEAGVNGDIAPLTLTSATYDGSDLTVDGTYTQAPGETLTVDFYVNTSATPGQGSVYIGSGTINTDASGTFSLTLTPINPVVVGNYIITTVTDSLNQTSTYSNNLQATAPGNSDPTGSVTIDNTSPDQGDTLTASNTLADADGLTGPISYQWQRDGSDISGATGFTYITTQADVGSLIRVIAKYTDDLGTAESVASADTAAVANANDDPTGSVTIDNTSPDQGDTLTASNTLGDPDGLTGPISYQWQRDGVDISGATGSTYTTNQADVGSLISVVAKYTDDLGANESVSSAATAAVTDANDIPVIGGVDTGTVTEDSDPDSDGILETSGAMTISDPDPGEDRFAAGTIPGNYGELIIDAAGSWNYKVDNGLAAIQQLGAGDSLNDTVTVTTEDGTNHDIVITISGTNDTPTVSTASIDTGAEDMNKVFTHAELLVFTGAADIDDVDADLTIQIANVTNGTLNMSGGTGGTGTIFTFSPDQNFFGDMTFDYQVSDYNGASSPVGTATIAISPVADTPEVSNTATLPDTPSDPIVISPNTSDGVEVTHFQITGITDGTLYHADGTTPINNGDYITLAQAQNGLKFKLASDSAFGSFNVRPSKDGVSVDPGSGSATPIISVLSAPTVPDADVVPDEPVEEDPEIKEDTIADDPLNDSAIKTTLSNNSSQKKSFIQSDASAAKGGVYESQVTVDFKPVMERLSRIQESESSNILSVSSLEQQFNKLMNKLPDFRISYENLKNSLDDFRKEANMDMQDSEAVIGSAIAVSTGLSVGYVVWMIRGGMLLSSMISSMPAWQLADPLPILKNTRNDDDDDDDESLETIIKNSSDNDDKKKQGPDRTGDLNND